MGIACRTRLSVTVNCITGASPTPWTRVGRRGSERMPWQQQARLTKAEVPAARRDRKKAGFLVDESVDVEVALRLRREGFTADHVSEVGLDGHSDEDVFAYGWREDRIILTHDTDFLNNRRFPP